MAFGSDADELVCHLTDALFHPGFLGLPCTTAELVQKSLFVAIAAQKFDVLDRQIQPVATGIFQQKAFMRCTGCGDHLKSLEDADPMIDMHDQIARAEGAVFGQEIVGPLLARWTPHQPGRPAHPVRK